MPAKANFKPSGYSTASPYLCVKGAAKAIEFYKEVFGATERMRMDHQGKIGHAELQFGDTVVMLADEFPEMDFVAPTDGGSGRRSIQVHVYVPDADEAAQKAAARGGKVIKAVETMFYGDRGGKIADPFGHVWHVSTHVEDVSPQEMERRMSEMAKQTA